MTTVYVHINKIYKYKHKTLPMETKNNVHNI